jgi:GMP synthase (glutamine-hydrolysing)
MNGHSYQDPPSLYFAHQDQVLELPPGAELLGGSEFCPVGIYSIDDQVFAVQGHPEFTRSIMQDILARKDGDEDLLQTAESSLEDGTPDGQLFAQWIVNFLTNTAKNN